MLDTVIMIFRSQSREYSGRKVTFAASITQRLVYYVMTAIRGLRGENLNRNLFGIPDGGNIFERDTGDRLRTT